MIETTQSSQPSQPSLRACLAPAKLNLFLHITGRRPDGYHLLQTVFQLLDWGDMLHFTSRADGRIRRKTPIQGIAEADDLTVRAAQLLQAETHTSAGVDIEIDKCLPMGAGLGGGSSNAATTMLALNRLWKLNLPRQTLQALALRLGADVPFFVFGQNAFAQGIGETLQAVSLPPRYFLVITPNAHVSTAEAFAGESLTRDSKAITMLDFLGSSGTAGWPESFGRNDMQQTVAEKYPEIAQVLAVSNAGLNSLAPARMTGSGASVFAAFPSLEEAQAAQAKLPDNWASVVAASLDTHPLFAFAS